MLLLGDLNAGPDTPEIAALASHDGILDAWTASGGDDGDGVTLSASLPIAPRGAVEQLDRRIDYVLFRRSTGVRRPR